MNKLKIIFCFMVVVAMTSCNQKSSEAEAAEKAREAARRDSIAEVQRLKKERDAFVEDSLKQVREEEEARLKAEKQKGEIQEWIQGVWSAYFPADDGRKYLYRAQISGKQLTVAIENYVDYQGEYEIVMSSENPTYLTYNNGRDMFIVDIPNRRLKLTETISMTHSEPLNSTNASQASGRQYISRQLKELERDWDELMDLEEAYQLTSSDFMRIQMLKQNIVDGYAELIRYCEDNGYNDDAQRFRSMSRSITSRISSLPR